MTPLISRPKARQKAFIGTIVVDGDITVAGWLDEGGASTNIYDSMDDDSDSTWGEVSADMAICGLSEQNTNGVFTLQNPSTAPSGAETVTIRFRARLTGPGTSKAADVTMFITDIPGTKNVTGDLYALNTSWTDYPYTLTAQEARDMAGAGIGWNDARARIEITDQCDLGGDGVTVEIAQIEVEFT